MSDIDDGGAQERGLTHEHAIRLAEAYVGAYNDRDLEAMLALQHENVVSYPSRMFGPRQTSGHDGVRDWWQTMVDSGRWYEVVIREIRVLIPDRIAILGEIRTTGSLSAPGAW